MGAPFEVDLVLRWQGEVIHVTRCKVRERQRLDVGALGVPVEEGGTAALEVPDFRRTTSMRSRFGDVEIEVTPVGVPPRQGVRFDGAAWLAQAVSASWHLTLLGALGMFTFTAPAGESTDGEATAILRDRTLATERALGGDHAVADPDDLDPGDRRDLAAAPADPRIDQRGLRAPPNERLREAPASGRRSNPSATTTVDGRSDALAEARTFGMIDLVGQMRESSPSPWGAFATPFGRHADDGERHDTTGNAWRGSSLLEGDILSLSGVGEGAGGLGTGIALGNVGTVGRCDGCTGAPEGNSFGRGRLGARGHRVVSSILRCAGPSESPSTLGKITESASKAAPCVALVNGRLPPEVVQRVVRQNFGRFRACYEAALATNPSLEGRIVIKFVVDRDGSVSTAQDGGSDFRSATTVACVVRAVGSLSFPRPEGGIVTVVYPLILSAG